MAKRPQWAYEVMGERSLLDVALDVHGTAHGAIERNPDDQAADVRVLGAAMAMWEPPTDSSRRFDLAVWELMQAALAEHRERAR